MRLDGDDCAIVWGTACVALATAVLIGVFALGFFIARCGYGNASAPEVPRTIRLQLEALGASASAPTITTTNENEKETTGND